MTRRGTGGGAVVGNFLHGGCGTSKTGLETGSPELPIADSAVPPGLGRVFGDASPTMNRGAIIGRPSPGLGTGAGMGIQRKGAK